MEEFREFENLSESSKKVGEAADVPEDLVTIDTRNTVGAADKEFVKQMEFRSSHVEGIAAETLEPFSVFQESISFSSSTLAQHGTAKEFQSSELGSFLLEDRKIAGGDSTKSKTTVSSTVEEENAGLELKEASGDLEDFFGVKGLDQISPPRSPFMELDKSSLSDDIAAAIEPESGPASAIFNQFDDDPAQPVVASTIIKVETEGFDEEHIGSCGGGLDTNSTSLDDIQPPEFYESGDSSASKEAPPGIIPLIELGNGKSGAKSTTDSQILEPDDIEEYLPKDPVVQSELYPVSAESNLLKEHEIKSMDMELDSSTKMEHPSLPKEDHQIKPEQFDFYIKEPQIISEESLPFESTVPMSEDEYERKVEFETEPKIPAISTDEQIFELRSETVERKTPSPLPGYQLADSEIDLEQFEAKHAELSSFLNERDPSSNKTLQLITDDYECVSEDSISPNPPIPGGATFGLPSDQPKEVIEEPIIKSKVASKIESLPFFSMSEKISTNQEEKASPESFADDFEMIPPKIPPHQPSFYENENIGKLEASDSTILQSPPSYGFDADGSKTTTAPVVQETKSNDDLFGLGIAGSTTIKDISTPQSIVETKPIDTILATDEHESFTPKGSFETISTIESKENIPETVPAKPKPSPKEKQASAQVEQRKRELKTLSDAEKNEISIEAQKILNTFLPKAWFDSSKLHPKVSELVYWRDPKKTGGIFAGLMLLLIGLSCLSFISVIAYGALLILSGTFAFRIYKNILQAIHKTQEGSPFKEFLEKDINLQNEKTNEIVTILIGNLTNFIVELRHLFLVEDLMDSIKFGGVMYVFTYIGSWFNGLTLVTIGVIGLFSLPKTYELNKNVIDQYLDLILAKISQTSKKLNEILPFGKKDKIQ